MDATVQQLKIRKSKNYNEFIELFHCEQRFRLHTGKEGRVTSKN